MSPNKKQKVSHKLGDVVWRELGVQLDKEHQGSDWGGELSPNMLLYAREDSRVLLHLVDALGPKIREADLHKVADIECRALPAITWMANAGVPFDSEGWRSCLDDKEAALRRLRANLDELAADPPEDTRWNWNSPKQVIEAFRLLGVTLSDTKGETLARSEHPLAKALLEYRKTSKLVGTYGPNLLKFVEGGRIYGSWWQNGAGTGRMASSSPNLQNLPPEVRRYVKAPEGRRLVIADYSQVELRIAAKISGDKRMLAAFANGEDIHAITARSLTGRKEVTKQERKLAKSVNFGLLYGMSPGGLRNYARASYGVEMTKEEAERYWREFFGTYPGLRAWHDREYRQLKKHGSTETRTLTGRRRTGVTKLTERLNSPVQGTGADGLKLSLALLYERRGDCPGAVPILAVHDEVVVECLEEQAEEVKAWLVEAMVDGMDEVLNSGLGTDNLERVLEHLKEQTESGRAASERLADQAMRQQEAGRAFAQESVNAYMDFLDTAFSQYREGTQRAGGSAQEGTRAGSQAIADVVGIAANTTRDTADIAAGQPPIEGYDEMNVEEITEQLEGLSEAELRRVRNYEQGNKNRSTLVEAIDSRLTGSA